jgi:16S rRNA (guanine527-N7)-methyltransferase
MFAGKLRARREPLTQAEPSVVDSRTFANAVAASPAMMSDLEAFRCILEEWNTRMNLVGPSAMAQFWGRHAFDSAQLLALAPARRVWADLGAGAGFPGIVLAILLKGVPGAMVHLIDSQAKRTRFLSEVVQQLSLPAMVHTGRAEALTPPEGLEIVTARAFAPMTKLLQYAYPYLRDGVTGLFLKGRDVENELATALQTWNFQGTLHPSLSDPTGRIVQIERLRHA